MVFRRKKAQPVQEVVEEVSQETPKPVDINNPEHGNLTYEEIQAL